MTDSELLQLEFIKDGHSVFKHAGKNFVIDYLGYENRKWMAMDGALIIRAFGNTLKEVKENAIKEWDEYVKKTHNPQLTTDNR